MFFLKILYNYNSSKVLPSSTQIINVIKDDQINHASALLTKINDSRSATQDVRFKLRQDLQIRTGEEVTARPSVPPRGSTHVYGSHIDRASVPDTTKTR